MAISGKGGSLKYGDAPTAVTEIKQWSLDLGADTPETTNFDSGGKKEFIAGVTEWSGKAEGNYKPGDASQKAIISAWQNGTVVKLTLGADAATAFSGDALIKTINLEAQASGDAVKFSFDFQGTGALTVPA